LKLSLKEKKIVTMGGSCSSDMIRTAPSLEKDTDPAAARHDTFPSVGARYARFLASACSKYLTLSDDNTRVTKIDTDDAPMWGTAVRVSIPVVLRAPESADDGDEPISITYQHLDGVVAYGFCRPDTDVATDRPWDNGQAVILTVQGMGDIGFGMAEGAGMGIAEPHEEPLRVRGNLTLTYQPPIFFKPGTLHARVGSGPPRLLFTGLPSDLVPIVSLLSCNPACALVDE
jgi:hypothetical protein